MQRRIVFAAAAALGLAVGCTGSSGERLSETECEELVDHIRSVLPSTDVADAVEKCAAGETWSREGYQCAMKANFRAALSSCLMKYR